VEAAADEAEPLEGAEEASAVPVAAGVLVLPEERADHSEAVVVVLREGIHLTEQGVIRVCWWDKFLLQCGLPPRKSYWVPITADGLESPSSSHRLVARRSLQSNNAELADGTRLVTASNFVE
jgi:hypothetical protein